MSIAEMANKCLQERGYCVVATEMEIPRFPFVYREGRFGNEEDGYAPYPVVSYRRN